MQSMFDLEYGFGPMIFYATSVVAYTVLIKMVNFPNVQLGLGEHGVITMQHGRDEFKPQDMQLQVDSFNVIDSC